MEPSRRARTSGRHVKAHPPLAAPCRPRRLAACTGGGASGSPGATSAPRRAPPASPTASPASVGAIDHATGATDVLLRYEQGGGFIAPSFLATQAPIFTLYGDGTIVFRNPLAEPPPPVGSVFRQNPFRTAKLSEDQIQDVLAFALGDGGLGTARANYENNMVADASTAIFTIDAGGLKKAVSVYALGMEVEGVPDLLARAAFQRLADRLSDFDKGGTIATDVYAPTGYRGILEDGQAAPDQKAWPWADLKPTDFAFPADPNAYPDGHPRPDPRTGRAARARGHRGRLPRDGHPVARSVEGLFAVAATAPARRDRIAPATRS